ncbi:MAG: hypothetical protein RI959_776, partial [Pseudomonadota bacterium]
MNRPTPAIVTQLAARRLPRWVLLLLGLLYVLPGLVGRQPWRQADLASFGVMLDMAQHPNHWLSPQLLGQPADVAAWLPYWLGAVAIKTLPFMAPDMAVRVPFGLLLVLTLVSTWYATYHLARLHSAQPMSFAFGGQALGTDYALALADASLLALIASLGLAQLGHENTPDAAQLACASVMLYACARLASPHARWLWLSALTWWGGAVGLALSGAPWLGLFLGLGWLVWTAAHKRPNPSTRRWRVWVWALSGTLVAAALAWELELPRRVEVWADMDAWLQMEPWLAMGHLLAWFAWPVWPLALWTLWRWRTHLGSAHIALPLWFALAGLGSSWLLGGSDRALLMALPGMACLAAFALPTLSRNITALIDWFALLFFSLLALVIWVMWVAMQTGIPAKPAANVAKLAPGFQDSFSWAIFIPALLATLAWLAVMRWRIGKHQPALWKSLVLSASGITLCWLLLLTLWLPLLNHGMGLASMSRRIASHIPPGACVAVHGLNAPQITGLIYHGGLQLQRLGQEQTPAESCTRLVISPVAFEPRRSELETQGWTLRASVPRL